jgi:hypothetical protein
MPQEASQYLGKFHRRIAGSSKDFYQNCEQSHIHFSEMIIARHASQDVILHNWLFSSV